MATVKERFEAWQNSVSTMETTMAQMAEQLAALEARPQSDPDKIAALEAALAEARTELEALKAQPVQSPPKSAEENPSQGTPPVTSSETPAPAPQTRAAKWGWI